MSFAARTQSFPRILADSCTMLNDTVHACAQFCCQNIVHINPQVLQAQPIIDGSTHCACCGWMVLCVLLWHSLLYSIVTKHSGLAATPAICTVLSQVGARGLCGMVLCMLQYVLQC